MWHRLSNLFARIAIVLGLLADPAESTALGQSITTQTRQSMRLQGHIRTLQMRSLLDNLGLSLYSTMGVAALATWALWRYESAALLSLWLASVVSVVMLRLWHRAWVQRELVEDAHWLIQQLNWIRVGCLANGMLWGTLSMAFFSKEPLAQSMLILIIAGVSAAAIAVLAADRLSALALVIPTVVPLSVRLVLQPDDVGHAIGIISIAYVIVVAGGVRRAHAYIFGHIQLTLQGMEREQHLRLSQEQLKRQHDLSTAIARSQDRFIRDSEPHTLFSNLLSDLLSLTESDYGLIAEWHDQNSSTNDLNVIAVFDRSWDEPTNATYRQRVLAGLNLEGARTLFDSALSSGIPVVLNDLTMLANRAGLPGGQAMLRNLVAVPLSISGQRLGLVVIANRSCGYDQALMDFLQPLLATIAQILQAVRGDEERRRAEKTSRESAERTRAVIDNVIDGIILMDATGAIVEFNPAAERIYGYAAQEVIGRTIHALKPSGDTSYDRMIEACIKLRDAPQNSSVVRELVGLRKTGEQFELELSVRPTPLGGQVMFTAVVRDITEQKRAQQALIDASEAAAAANRAKSEFLANMSHEIRTPMNGVLGMTELLIDTSLDRVQRDYADTIRDSAKSLLTVVNDILDYSKVEAGKLELEKIDMDLRDVMEDVARLVAMQAHTKKLEVIVQVDTALPDMVIGDPGRIRQVLLNLGSNAVKFTQHGEVALSLQVISSSERELKVRCTVRDTGMGISSQRLDMLFKPFSQGDSSMTRRFGGTGLGLSIVRSLVELMGGEVGVESTVGRGSTFWFTARFELHAQANAMLQQKTVLRSVAAGQRVLIVDDNQTNRRVLMAQVQRCGLKPSEAASAGEALNLIEAAHKSGQPFAVALIDQQMPGFDGAKLGATLSTQPHFKTLRLVLLTSMGRRGDARRFSELGFSGYLLKPVTQRDLMDCLLLLLNGQSDENANAGAPMITRHQLRALRAREQRTLLLVDDNPVNQKVGRALLERLSYRVDIASNGLEALQAWEKNRYDAILMDCQMPEMDGYQTTREIRKREAGKRHVPIIAVTAHAMAGAAEECLAAGMDAYQSKPLDHYLLEQCLNKFFDERTLAEPTKPAPVNAAAPVDWSRIDEVSGGDLDFAVELVGAFSASSQQSVQLIEKGLAGNNLTAVQTAAHSLKGAAGSVGATLSHTLAAKLEQAAKNSNASEAALIFETLRLEVARAHDYMQQRLAAAA